MSESLLSCCRCLGEPLKLCEKWSMFSLSSFGFMMLKLSQTDTPNVPSPVEHCLHNLWAVSVKHGVGWGIQVFTILSHFERPYWINIGLQTSAYAQLTLSSVALNKSIIWSSRKHENGRAPNGAFFRLHRVFTCSITCLSIIELL